ncbi:MAG TPA: cellulase family glycosylhydrolase [Bacteroidales bacterium]|nr:cellulase family glycosylhydrolase [Bacteroidales bacterium]
MKSNNRRAFLKTTAAAAAAFALSGTAAMAALSDAKPKNKLPRWKGFNLLDFFSPERPKGINHSASTEQDFKWMRDWGFDFVRIPMAYPRYLSFDPSKPITKEDFYKIDYKVVEEVEKLVEAANKYSLHVSLNLHRAPGYCINAGFNEPYNLWKDTEAQEAFNYHWGMWAERFKNVSKEKVSFDLLNEPAYREDMNDQFSKSGPLNGEQYRKVAKGAVEAIRKISPDRLIVADGNSGGHLVTPELTDLNVGQSCRGYFPHVVSHYQAPWVWKNPSDAPTPVWPGVIGGQHYGKEDVVKLYTPWIELIKQGVGVHCGECGCWKKTPHDVFLAWFEDVISILTENNIGYALWNFRGDFGILDSGRDDAPYTDWYGHKLDGKLLALLKKY